MSDHKDMTNRHLRHKLQSLSRRLDELEEATNKLQKSEDELLDLQDKIIQAEGSNSSLLGDVEALRKRLLRIQGKDEEVRKAEDLCRTVREKLEEEESLTKELKAEIERLQQRMAELEKLEEAFGKSKSDCSQLCLSLNEEKNLTKKLSSELEALKSRLKEVEGSETKLDRAEEALAVELEKLKSFTQAFVGERKRLLERQREDEKMIMKLKEKLDHQKNRLGLSADPGHADFMRSRIEDELSSSVLLSSKLAGGRRSLDYLKQADNNFGFVNKSENEKNSLDGSQEEDNKVKELTQEVERLKSRLKQLEIVEEDLKCSESKNGELHEKFQIERNRARQLSEQVDHLRIKLCGKDGIRGNGFGNVDKHGNGNITSSAKILENGKAENEEIAVKASFRQEKPKYRSVAGVSESSSPKHRNRELSPQHKRETKLKSKDLSYSEESSPKTVRRAPSPAHKSRRTPRTPTATVFSDNGLREVPRANDEKNRAANSSSINTHSGDIKKTSVLSRYPPAANDQKPLRTGHKYTDGGVKKSKEKLSNLYVGSDSESNNSDVMLETTSHLNSISAVGTETASVSDQEAGNQVEESVSVSALCSLSKANGSYTAYRSQVTPLLANDQSSEGHSSASETESIGSKPDPVTETTGTAVSSSTSNPRYARHPLVRDSNSEGSSSRSSFDEELQSKGQVAEVSHQGLPHMPSGIEIQRVCSPREGLRSRAVIKPAIVEIDRKEVMISEPLSANGKPKISTKPIVTTPSKITSSITFYPNDPTSSRTSSRSSSLSSEPTPIRERHTSTSNILIGLSSDHHGSISVPYEISIPKSEIPLRSSQDQDFGLDNHADSSLRSKLQNISRVETTSLQCRQHSNFDFQSPDPTCADYNDTESSIESMSSTSTVTSWRSQRQNQHSLEENGPDVKNVTVRSTWKNKGAVLADDSQGRGGTRTRMDGRESEDELDATSTWKAFPATTFDSDESPHSGRGPSGSAGVQKAVKPSPAEMYMRRINNVFPSSKDAEEAALRRGRNAASPSVETGGVGRTVPHPPVTSQSWSRSYTQQPAAADPPEPSLNPGNSPALWRRQLHTGDPHGQGSSYDRTTAAAARGAELWSPRGQGSGARAEGRRPWNHRQPEQQ